MLYQCRVSVYANPVSMGVTVPSYLLLVKTTDQNPSAGLGLIQIYQVSSFRSMLSAISAGLVRVKPALGGHYHDKRIIK